MFLNILCLLHIAGNFSNGITTIQCMYAPEFTAHSEGVRVNVEKMIFWKRNVKATTVSWLFC